MMAQRLLLLLLLFFAIPCFGKKYFSWSPALQQAYTQANSLRFVEAEKSLASIRLKEPDNLMVLHVENYLDFFRVYINEEAVEYKKLSKNADKRIKQIEEEGDQSSPYYLFLLADIRLQWVIAKLKFEEYSGAFFEANRAFKLLKKNAAAHPQFLPNKKDLGLFHAVIGTIPDNYKWAVETFSSLDGSFDEGMAEIKEVVEYAQKHDFIYEQEIYIFYSYLLLHLANESEEAWQVINTANLKPSESPVACFILGNVAMRTDRGDEAIAILQKRPTGAQFHPVYYIDYMLGLAKLQRLDKDANVALQRYVDKFKGRNFIKDAYQKLAWHYLLQGDRAGYDKNINLCKTKGYNAVGSDQGALHEAKSGEVPNLVLLKARLLFDGGRFKKANELLSGKKASDFAKKKDRLEFTYRLGRIAYKLGKTADALRYFQQAIDDGKKDNSYFACRGALEKGKIYEDQGNKTTAKEAYKLCLSISPDEHKTGLHQQAKAGLQRLK